MEVASSSGAWYILTVTDVATQHHWVEPLHLKSDASNKLHHIILSLLIN
jgi:hypothetical protein